MSWLNFNDSLNNIKGQLTNFANTVLSDEQIGESNTSVTSEDTNKKENKKDGDDFSAESSWKWSTDESKTDQLKTDETITNLKKKIKELEDENRDLIASLDQLDQNHQQNNEELMKLKDKLNGELEDVNEKYETLNMKYNKLALAENGYKKKLNEWKNKYEELNASQRNKDTEKNPEEVSSEIKKLENENELLLEKISVLEKNVEKNIDFDTKISEMSSKILHLEAENNRLNVINQPLIDNEKLIADYEDEIKNLQSQLDFQKVENSNKSQNVAVEEDINDNEEQIKELETLKDQLKQFEDSSTASKNELIEINKKMEEYRCNYENLIEKNIKNNEKYWKILNDKFKEYLPHDEFNNDQDNFDSIFFLLIKILENLESKCILMESKIFEINQNKTDIQNEKNNEIEKLIQNSEMLTQEVFKKTKEIKDLEEECSQLMKNNELLISKLSESNEKGLQTIFEFNEDNVDCLEKQLDIANERINELEEKLCNSPNADNFEFNEKTEENETTETLSLLKDENVKLQEIIDNLRYELNCEKDEKLNYKDILEKMNIESETTEYQFNEIQIQLETYKEELKSYKQKIDSITLENNYLKTLRNKDTDDKDTSNKDELILTKKRFIEWIEHLEKNLKQFKEKIDIRIQEKEIELENLIKNVQLAADAKTELKKQLGFFTETTKQFQKELDTSKEENQTFKKLYSDLCEKLNIEYEENTFSTNILECITNLKKQIEEQNLNRLKTNQQQEEYFDKLKKDIQELTSSRNELIEIVQTKHQESLTYHAEIQRLTEILKNENDNKIQLKNQIELLNNNSCSVELLKNKEDEIEKLNDQIVFLREKCDGLAKSILEEQSKGENERLLFSEKETTLSKKLERLQDHLMEMEEHYTQELLQSEQKIALLQAKLNEVERREKDSSTIYTSVSIRANQQNEALHQQLQSITTQRDEFKKKLMEMEDENNVKTAAVLNLQLVLEQFQKDKEADVVRETERIRRQVKQEQKIQEELRNEIVNLESQINESKQGLQAALRLTDQLELSKKQVSTLKEEITVLTEKLNKKEEELKIFTSQTDGKVDKSLVKNLIIGFVSSNKNFNKDQMQILKIIATVLDFNEQEHNKVNLNQIQQRSWLTSLLTPVPGDDAQSYESLSRAFVNFLENESKPRNIPSLLSSNSIDESNNTVSRSGSTSSSRTTPTPIVLNEITLPTFSDFPQHRNSSSILKGVLKDNS